MILIITSKRDSHIAAVSRHLTKAGAKWVRINIEDFATNVEVEIEPAKGTGILRMKDSGLVVSLDEVGAVWYRKPDPIDIRHFDMDPAALDYVEAEFNEIIHGLYALLNRAYWINDPFSTELLTESYFNSKRQSRLDLRSRRRLSQTSQRQQTALPKALVVIWH